MKRRNKNKCYRASVATLILMFVNMATDLCRDG